MMHDGFPADFGFRDSGIRNEDATPVYCSKWTQNKTSRIDTDFPRERFPASARTAGSGESVAATFALFIVLRVCICKMCFQKSAW